MECKLGDLLLNTQDGIVYEVTLIGDEYAGLQTEAMDGFFIVDRVDPKGYKYLEPEDVVDMGKNEYTSVADIAPLHQDEIKFSIFQLIFENTGDSSEIMERTRAAVDATNLVINKVFIN